MNLNLNLSFSWNRSPRGDWRRRSRRIALCSGRRGCDGFGCSCNHFRLLTDISVCRLIGFRTVILATATVATVAVTATTLARLTQSWLPKVCLRPPPSLPNSWQAQMSTRSQLIKKLLPQILFHICFHRYATFYFIYVFNVRGVKLGCIGPSVWLRNYIWRCLLCFLTPGGVPETTRETFCNSWTNHGKSIHGKSMENPMQKPLEKPWKTQWEIHGKSMGNHWKIKTEKRKCFPGSPCPTKNIVFGLKNWDPI